MSSFLTAPTGLLPLLLCAALAPGQSRADRAPPPRGSERVAFFAASAAPFCHESLFVLDVKSGERVEALADTHGAGPYRIAWRSSDELVVAIDWVREQRLGRGVFPDLWRVGADGSAPRELPGGKRAHLVAVSPDGRWIASGGTTGLHLTAAEGKGYRTSSVRFEKVFSLAWSADSKGVVVDAFFWVGKSAECGTWWMAADTGTTRKLSDAHGFPCLAPSGTKLFVLDSTWPPGDKRILRIDLASGARDTVAERVHREHAFLLSPDGRRLVFLRGAPEAGAHDEATELFLIDSDGGHERRIGPGAHPSWAPDGRRLVYEREGAVWLLDVGTLDSRQVATGRYPVWSR